MVIIKRHLNPICLNCGLPFVRKNKVKVKCNTCKRKEEREYQKNYYKNLRKNKK